MRVSEAKDFLVRQTAEQSLLEGLSLSDLEKRMMYFTESGEASEDPIKLNDEFEAEYDTPAYEEKISKLLHHAYARSKKENPESARLWDESIRTLRRGDHYLVVLWEQESTERPPYDSLKLLGTAILVIVVGVALIAGFSAISDHYGIHWNSGPRTQRSLPAWIQRLFLTTIAGGYVYYVVLPWILKKPPAGISQLLLWLLRVKRKDRPDKIGR